MIPFASQRGGGADLATHLQNATDNERVEIVEIRGTVARDLHGAFAEWQLYADCLTKCENYLYSLSVNPWDKVNGPMNRIQYFDYINRVEARLGLSGQPRAVVFHVKNGRAHAHVVWSRIDTESEKAIHLSHDREKLMQVTRDFARDHDLILPDGYERHHRDRQKSQQNTLYEQHVQNITGQSKQERMEQITKAWRESDSAKAFVQALANRGYILATGNRPYLVVDMFGHVSALPRMIYDKSVRANDVRSFLEKEFPVESLPTPDEAKAYAEWLRQQSSIEQNNHDYLAQRQILASKQAQRRAELEQKEREMDRARDRSERKLQEQQAADRAALDARHKLEERKILEQREKQRPTGLADFLGRVSGVNFARKKLHELQDKRRHARHDGERRALYGRQATDTYNESTSHAMAYRDLNRQFRALESIEARELQSLQSTFERKHNLLLQKEREQVLRAGLKLSVPRGMKARPNYHSNRAQLAGLAQDNRNGGSGQAHAEVTSKTARDPVADAVRPAADPVRKASFNAKASPDVPHARQDFSKAARPPDERQEQSGGGEGWLPDCASDFADASGAASESSERSEERGDDSRPRRRSRPASRRQRNNDGGRDR